MKYDPDTGIPRYVPDLGEEIEEGVTPEPKVITSKGAVFKGDKPLTKEAYEALRDGPTVANAESYRVLGPNEADEMLDKIVASAKPAKLDAHVATNEEVDMIEKMANDRRIENWAMLLRLINRLRQAEAK
jgi:hypothetical protein